MTTGRRPWSHGVARLACCWLGLALLALLAAPAPATAASAAGTTYQHAQAQYTAGNYLAAARLYESAIREGYTQPAAYYKLGLAFARLQQWDGVVWAMDTLRARDPAYAASHPLVAARLATAAAHGGHDPGHMPGPVASGAPGTSSSGPGPGSATAREVTAALRAADVYVAPTLTAAVGAAGLATLAADARTLHDKGTTTKYAVLAGVPPPYASLGQFVQGLFSTLGLSHAVLVAVDPRGVAAWSDRVPVSDVQNVVSTDRARFLNGTYAGGLTAVAHDIAARADAAQTASTAGRSILIVLLLLVVAVVLAILVGSRWRRWQRSYVQAMGWRDAVAALENEVSTDVQYLTPNDPRQTAFAAGAEYYGKAATTLDTLQHRSPFAVAFGGAPLFRALGEARLNLQEAEGRLREAGATGPGIAAASKASPHDPRRAAAPAAAPAAYRDANAIAPTPAQAACFFCGRPLDPATAEAVFVPVGGQQRRVLVCQEHGTAVQAGQQPPIRTFASPSLGRTVPWWGAPEYVPYRDYDPYYGRRGGGIGWGDLLLYETLFNRPTTNVIYVDDDRWQGMGQDGYGPGGLGFDSIHPDAGSFDSGTRDMPSAPEASFGTDGGWGSGGDRS